MPNRRLDDPTYRLPAYDNGPRCVACGGPLNRGGECFQCAYGRTPRLARLALALPVLVAALLLTLDTIGLTA